MSNILNKTEGSIPDAMNARGRLLTTKRRNKVPSVGRSTCGGGNFGDLGCEATTRHEDHAKAEDGTKKDLRVLKQQLRKNMKLHRQTNELQ